MGTTDRQFPVQIHDNVHNMHYLLIDNRLFLFHGFVQAPYNSTPRYSEFFKICVTFCYFLPNVGGY